MKEALIEYPWINWEGEEDPSRIRYYSEKGEEGKLICYETGTVYDVEVIELYPCSRHYFEYEEEEPEDENRLETETDIT